MNTELVVAVLMGPAAVTADRAIRWLRGHGRDAAETGLAVDQRWEQYTDRIEKRMQTLEARVDELEQDLARSQNRVKGLTAEVDRYKDIAKSLARHVLRLRDVLARADSAEPVPPIPPDIEDALTVIDLP